MKELILTRHGEAQFAHNGHDHTRPLTSNGVREAETMGRFIARRQNQPELAVCSTARRTQDTLERVARALPDTLQITSDDNYYLASAGKLLENINQLDDQYQRVMIVAHNPGLHRLCATLLHDTEALHRNHLLYDFPTGTLVAVSFPAERWADIRPQSGRLIDVFIPRMTVAA